MKKIKKLGVITCILFTIFGLTACLERTELNKLGIVSGIGIDKSEDTYTLTVQILNPSAVSGESQNALPVYNLKASGDSIHEAFSRVGQITSSALYLSHLNVIVINEEFAEAGFAPLLNFALRHAEIRPDISIVVAKDSDASEILSVVTALDTIPAAQMNVGAKVGSHTSRQADFNFYEVVDMVNCDNMNLVLNAVSIHRENEHSNDSVAHKNGINHEENQNGSTVDNILDITVPVQLRIKHLAVFQGENLVGFLDDYEAQFYNMMLGENKRYVFVNKTDDGYYTSVRIPSVDTSITTDIKNNEATITMNLSAVILENTYPIDLTNTQNLSVMASQVEEHLTTDMKAFVERIQTELKSDILGIGGQAYYKEHKEWKAVAGYWQDIFPDITIHLDVNVEIDSVGEIGNVTL